MLASFFHFAKDANFCFCKIEKLKKHTQTQWFAVLQVYVCSFATYKNGTFAVFNLYLSILQRRLILSFAKFTLSKAPGASNLRCNDFATSISGEIITSIGKFLLL